MDNFFEKNLKIATLEDCFSSIFDRIRQRNAECKKKSTGLNFIFTLFLSKYVEKQEEGSIKTDFSAEK